MIKKALSEYWYLIAAAILIGLITHKYGPGIDGDGVYYSLFSKSIASGTSLMHYDDVIKGEWPPMYPIVLSVFRVLGLSVNAGVRGFNFILFAATIWAGRAIAKKFIDSEIYLALFTILLLFSFPLLSLFSKTLTEPPFIFLTAFMLYAIISLEKEYHAKHLVFLSASVLLMCLFRYAGIYAGIIGFGYLIWIFRLNVWVLKRLISGAFVSFLPIVVWLFRNYYFTGHPAGMAGRSGPVIFRESFISYLNSISEWILPKVLNEGIRIFFLGIILLMIIFVMLKDRVSFQGLGILPVFSLLYSFIIFLTVGLGLCYPLDYRYLSPIYLPLILLIFYILQKVSNLKSRRRLILFCIVCIGGTQFASSAVFISYRFYNGGGGYNTKQWQTSPLPARLKAGISVKRVYSNNQTACQFFTESYSFGIDSSLVLNPAPGPADCYALVIIKNAKRNIEGFSLFKSNTVSGLTKWYAEDQKEAKAHFFGMDENDFLRKFAIVNSIEIFKEEEFSDGYIFYFVKQEDKLKQN